jgi:hypothetical protein
LKIGVYQFAVTGDVRQNFACILGGGGLESRYWYKSPYRQNYYYVEIKED